MDRPVRYRGTVKFFNREKGYGFIAPEEGGRDVFVHVSSVLQAGIPYLDDGSPISFELKPDIHGRGQQAVELQLL